MRPASIVNFERVVIFSLLLGLINSFLVREEVTAQAAQSGMTSSTVLLIQGITIAIFLTLVYFIARKGSPVAKWIYVVLSVLGLIMTLLGLGNTFAMGVLPGLLTVAQVALSVVALWLLFRPDSNAWFAEGRSEVDPDVFR